MRQTSTAELNKGEARNSLVRAVNLHRLGRFRDRSHENLSIRAPALNLVVTAIIYWNTLYMGRIVDAMRAAGNTVLDHLLASLSPLGWELARWRRMRARGRPSSKIADQMSEFG